MTKRTKTIKKKVIRPTRVLYLEKMKLRLMKEQRESREPPGTTAFTVIKQYILLLWWELPTNNDNEKKDKNIKEALHSIGKKVDFTAVFTVIDGSGALPEEAFIHTAKMTAIKIALKEIQKKEDKRWVMHTES